MEKKLKVLLKPLDLMFLFLIKFYKIFISPVLGNNCRFFPSCSEYAIDVVKQYGIIKGAPYISKRLISCHPFGRSGYDPVPKYKIKKNDFKIVNPSISQVRVLRNQILYKNLPRSFSRYPEDLSKSSVHYGVLYKSELISIVTVMEKVFQFFPEKNSLQIRGMATMKSFQNKGIGSYLLENVIKKTKNTKYELIWCNARIKTITFYTNKLFTPIGDIFTIVKIGQHKTLYRKLTK